MTLHNFEAYAKDFVWNLDIIGTCSGKSKATKDEEHEVYAFMNTMTNADIANCSMSLPGTFGGDNEISVIAQFRRRATDHFVYKAIDYLSDRYGMKRFRAELQAWESPDGIGWVFYQGIYTRSKGYGNITCQFISLAEAKMIVEDRKRVIWEDVTDLLLDLRHNIDPKDFGGSIEVPNGKESK